MPLYEFECEDCKTRFERIQKYADPNPDVCPSCGKGQIRRMFSSPAIQFKGSGFYITDYAKKSSSEASSGSKSAGSEQVGRRQRVVLVFRVEVGVEVRVEVQRPSTKVDGRSPPTLKVARRDSKKPESAYRGPARSAALEAEFAQVVAEGLREIRPAQREIDDRFQKSQLVAGVVPDAVDLVAVNRPLLAAAAAGRWSTGSLRCDP